VVITAVPNTNSRMPVLMHTERDSVALDYVGPVQTKKG
jgi:hypothetical protein